MTKVIDLKTTYDYSKLRLPALFITLYICTFRICILNDLITTTELPIPI